MANAKRDENRIPVIIALLDSDGKTIKNVCASPVSHSLCVSDGTTGTDNGNNIGIDENHMPTIFAVSYVDGRTPVALYADSSGNILIQST